MALGTNRFKLLMLNVSYVLLFCLCSYCDKCVCFCTFFCHGALWYDPINIVCNICYLEHLKMMTIGLRDSKLLLIWVHEMKCLKEEPLRQHYLLFKHFLHSNMFNFYDNTSSTFWGRLKHKPVVTCIASIVKTFVLFDMCHSCRTNKVTSIRSWYLFYLFWRLVKYSYSYFGAISGVTINSYSKSRRIHNIAS